MVGVKKCVLFSLVAFVSLNAEVLSYQELKNKPKSLAKDYYINRLINEGSWNKEEIRDLRKDVYRNKGKLAKSLNKILGIAPKKDVCPSVNSKNILTASNECKNAKLKPNFIKFLPQPTILKLISQMKNNSNIVNLLRGFTTSNPAKYYAQTGDTKNFYAYYNSLSDSQKNSQINISLSSQEMNTIANDEKNFKNLAEYAVINNKFLNLRKSMLGISDTHIDGQAAFMAGLNCVTLGEDSLAVKFFRKAGISSEAQSQKDNANFWVWLITKDKSVLSSLSRSNDYNVYSLYAKEMLNNKSLDVIVPQPTKQRVEDYDITDPFSWVNLRNKAKNANKQTLMALVSKFDTKETVGEYSYLRKLANGGADNYYPMPFMQYIGDRDTHRKALILGIARQESRFISGSVSISYALGLMQFMPFLANDIGKKKLAIPGFDQDDMFKPSVAYKFANYHLDWMEKTLQNPVFIAYAYNGGLGFTKKMLKAGKLFRPGKYEPFLSMELVPYAESRLYAKKVLANFVVYHMILDPKKEISIKQILDDLLVPSRSYSI